MQGIVFERMGWIWRGIIKIGTTDAGYFLFFVWGMAG